MRYYEHELPDGTFIRAPIGTAPEKIDEWAKQKFPEAFRGVADQTKPREGFFANVGAAARDLATNYGLAGGALFGDEQQAREESRAARDKNKNVKAVTWEDVKAAEGIIPTLKEAAAFSRDTLAGSLPQMGATAAGAMTGAKLGALTPVPGGALIGAGIGAVATGLPAFIGSNLARQDEEQPNAPLNVGAAVAAGAGQSALDAASTLFVFGKLFGVSRIGGEAIQSLLSKSAAEVEQKLVESAKRSLVGATARGAAQTAAVEVPTEVAQQILERAQAGLALTGEEANREYEAAAAGAVALGGPLGGLGGAAERGRGRQFVRQQDIAEKRAAAAKERQAAEAEQQRQEEYKKTPEYLFDLEKRYNAYITELNSLREQEKAIVKPATGTAEFAEKTKLRETIREKLKEGKELVSEFNLARSKLAKAKEEARVSKLTPLQYQMEQFGVDISEQEPTARVFTGEEPVITRKTPQQQYVEDVFKTAAQLDQGTYDASDYVDFLMRDPVMARQIASANSQLPGMARKESDTILAGVRLRLKEQEKQEKITAKEILQQQNEELSSQTTTTEPDSLALWKAALDEDAELREVGEVNFDYLNEIAEKALGQGSGERVSVSTEVTPTPNAKSVLRNVDSLFAARDNADVAADVAYRSGNFETGQNLSVEREQATDNLNKLAQATPLVREVVAARKEQEAALFDAFNYAEDIKAGRTLGGENKKTASSTPAILANKIKALKNKYISAVLQEAAISRKAFGLALRPDEARAAAKKIGAAFNELTTRVMAQPRWQVLENVVVQPAQMRGTEIVRGAVTEKIDPRPLEERRFGAYKAATKVLQEQIRQAAAEVISIPSDMRRDEQLLRTQFPSTEAAKIAEARGETAETRGGELRRRREFVLNKIDKALGQGIKKNTFPVQRALQKAREEIDKGRGSTDVVSSIEGQRFAPGLLDAAEEIADRALSGRKVDRRTVAQVGEAIRRDVPEQEGQQELFTEAAVGGEERSVDTELQNIERRIAELRGVKVDSLREGAERSRELTKLQARRSELVRRQQEIKQNKNALRKEGERLKADIGFIRANFRNFDKAPAVVAGRAAAKRAKELIEEIRPLLDKAIATKERLLEESRVRATKRVLFRENELQETYAKAIKEAKEIVINKRVEQATRTAKANLLKALNDFNELESRFKDATEELRDEDATYVSELSDRLQDQRKELEAAKKELTSIEQNVERAVDVQDVVATALANEWVIAEKKLLERAKKDLTKLSGAERAATEAEVRQQQAAVNRAEEARNALEKTKAEQNKLERLQQRLDLPGRRRVGGFTEEIGSYTNELIETAQEQKSASERALQELQQRRLKGDAKKASLQLEIDALTELRTRFSEELKKIPNKNAEARTRIQDEIADVIRQIGILRLQQNKEGLVTKEDLEDLRLRRHRLAGPVTRKQTAAPLTMRTGTAESAEATRAQDKYVVWSNKPTKPSKGYLRALEAAAEARRMEKSGEAESNLREDLEGLDFGYRPDMLFRLGEKTEASLAPEIAQKVMDAFLAKAPEHVREAIKFYPTQKDIPAKEMSRLSRLGAIDEEGKVVKGGVLSDGSILIVGDAHSTVNDLLTTLAHEITGHYGLRRLLGKDGIKKLAERVFSGDNDLTSIAKTLGVQDAAAYSKEASERLGETKEEAQLRLLDEVIAGISENHINASKLDRVKNFVREVIGAINAKLLEWGLRSPYKVSANDLVFIAKKARKEALREDGNSDPIAGQSVFRSAKAKHTNSDIGNAADAFIGKNKGLIAGIREQASGLGFKVRAVDSFAAVKEAIKRKDPLGAIQVAYDLMNYSNRSHFVYQTVMHGAPTREWWSKGDGKDFYKTEAKDGPSLKRVSELLADIKDFGNHQATSEAFTLLTLGKRAKTEGWDRVFADPKDASKEEIQRRNKAREVANSLANEYDDPNGASPFKEAYKEYQAYNKGVLQFANQAGLISDEEFRRLAGKQNYTPLFRADKHENLVLEIDQGKTITIGKLANEANIKQLLGGSGQVMDFFTASVRNAAVIMDASLHNIASREAVMALQAIGAARKVGEKETGENIVEFRRKGEKDLQRFEIDTEALGIPTELVVKGFAGVPASFPGLVRLMGVPANLLRKFVTRNPLYLFRQLIRDPVAAWLTTGAEFNPISDTVSQISKALTGTSDKTLDRRGITGGMLYADDITDLDRFQKEIQASSPWELGYWFTKADHMAHAADAITRRNVYEGALKEGASEIQATLAAYEAMPFGNRGTSPSIRALNHMVPFLSAMIQGWNVLWKAARGDMPLSERVDIRQKLLARGAMIGALTMVYAMAMENDEEYQKANTQERLNNWFLPLPGVGTVKIPIPFELGIFFKMLPEAVVRASQDDKDAATEFKDVGKALVNTAPNLIPQAVIPIIEGLMNKSFFTDRPIENRTLEGLDISQRYDNKTSELSKTIGFDIELFGTQLGVSPKMFEYMMSQYTAGVYPAFAALVDNILPAPDAAKPDRTLAELPLFRSVLVQEDAGGEVNRLYEKIDKFTRTSKTFKELLERDPDEAREYLSQNAAKIAAGSAAEKARAALNKFAQVENTIINNKGMSSEQKKSALDNIKKLKSNLARQLDAVLEV